MENFYARICCMENNQRKNVLGSFIGQLRGQQQHQIADALYDVLACYPDIPFLKDEQDFRLYLAWMNVYKLQKNPILQQIVNQPI